MPEDSAISHYVGDAGQRYHGGKRSAPEAAIPWIARLRAKKFSPHIKSSDHVFELGVGSGWNLAQLHCARRVGQDVSIFLAPIVEKLSVEFVAQSACLADATFEIVICHHTLEHVLQPPDVLRELRRLLRPSGKLLLFVPHEKERNFQRYRPSEPNHHLYSWNVQTLGNLLDETGFKLSEGGMGRFGYDRFAAAWATRLKLGEMGFRLIRTLAHCARPLWEVRIVAVKN